MVLRNAVISLLTIVALSLHYYKPNISYIEEYIHISVPQPSRPSCSHSTCSVVQDIVRICHRYIPPVKVAFVRRRLCLSDGFHSRANSETFVSLIFTKSSYQTSWVCWIWLHNFAYFHLEPSIFWRASLIFTRSPFLIWVVYSLSV